MFLLGPKVPIGRVPIGLADEFIGLKNSSQSARFWFIFGAFLLGTPPVFWKSALKKNVSFDAKNSFQKFCFQNGCKNEMADNK